MEKKHVMSAGKTLSKFGRAPVSANALTPRPWGGRCRERPWYRRCRALCFCRHSMDWFEGKLTGNSIISCRFSLQPIQCMEVDPQMEGIWTKNFQVMIHHGILMNKIAHGYTCRTWKQDLWDLYRHHVDMEKTRGTPRTWSANAGFSPVCIVIHCVDVYIWY